MSGRVKVAGLVSLVLSLLLVSTAYQVQADPAVQLQVTGYAREMPPGAVMGAAYLTLINGSPRARRLQKVELPDNVQASAAMHTTEEVDGVSRMRPLTEIAVAERGRLEMRPGATHLMLHGVKLKAGELLALRLVFADGETLDLQIPVRSAVSAQHQHHHG
ncbi:copper chaperone PCu(A)C [uncultured Microbulbifer sp.]|uniref:copper chaperone PCu(A)C n=1 Tax=uncultured Microbulbifer sp. TaxID=348147 RepID=UPI0025F0DD7B|nr:copper chaperone PCu(A)C [uncultured Microbulbifer sp.]